MQPQILIVNGSLGGRDGNTAAALSRLAPLLAKEAQVNWLHLADHPSQDEIEKHLTEAHAFVFASGVYWDSWSSHLQAFFENATEFEAGPIWTGKPAAALITMHSVGGKEVLSRLQGVLSTLGLLIPPMSGMVYSVVNHLALQTEVTPFHADIWSLQDLQVIANNLLLALKLTQGQTKSMDWTPWPVDASDFKRVWLK